MDRKRQKLTPGKTKKKLKLSTPDTTSHQSNLNFNCSKEVVIQIERLSESVVAEMTACWSALPPVQVIAELEQVKDERARDKINFETKKCELESKINKYEEQCTELQSENEKLQNEKEKLQSENEKLRSENKKLQSENKRLQKYSQDLESSNINVEEKSQMNLHNTDLNRQITKNDGQESEIAALMQKLVHMEAELKMVNESNDDVLDINSLPNEIILNIFRYLEQNQLAQIARVCRRWNLLTKSPVLWKEVNVKFSPSHRCQTTLAASFIKGLPSCVTSIRLNFMTYRRWIGTLDFAEFCVKLQEKCPQLETLMLTNSRLSNNLPAVINICSQFLQDVKNLIFHNSRFCCYRSTDECFGISKIKIFELFNCYIDYSSKSPFSKMPHLRQLNLFHTMVPESWFQDDTSFLNQLHILNVGRTLITFNIFPTIQNHGHNLKELYLCFCVLQDGNLTFTDSAFPHLKTICLSLTLVTYEDVVSLIESCPSLENVYVDEGVAESFAAHPFVVANRCKSGIVKAIDVIHKHNVDYSHT